MRKRIFGSTNEKDAVHLGFQIAPMIDVVFVVMLFFMAMAMAVKAERALLMKLPGPTLTDARHMPPYEVNIEIDEAGEIGINGGVVASPEDHRLTNLKIVLARMSQQESVLVTIEAQPTASYQRVIEVMDALGVAGLSNVTFTVPVDEE